MSKSEELDLNVRANQNIGITPVKGGFRISTIEFPNMEYSRYEDAVATLKRWGYRKFYLRERDGQA